MQLEFFEEPKVNDDGKYTKKISVPQYLPSEVPPKIDTLCNMSKYSELMRNISTADISEEERKFLQLAATRHIVFNYSKIADYYAHATPEMQKLMEQSALVIIDYNDAIANGYVKLSSTIKSIVEGTNNDAK